MSTYTSPIGRNVDVHYKVGVAEATIRILLAKPDLPISARAIVEHAAFLMELDDPTEDGAK